MCLFFSLFFRLQVFMVVFSKIYCKQPLFHIYTVKLAKSLCTVLLVLRIVVRTKQAIWI